MPLRSPAGQVARRCSTGHLEISALKMAVSVMRAFGWPCATCHFRQGWHATSSCLPGAVRITAYRLARGARCAPHPLGTMNASFGKSSMPGTSASQYPGAIHPTVQASPAAHIRSQSYPIVPSRIQSWSIVVNRGQSWSIVVNRGQSWSIVVNRGQSWSIVVNRGQSGQSWSIVVNSVVNRGHDRGNLSIVVNRGQSWSIVANRGQSWPIVANRGQSWPIVANRGQSWSIWSIVVNRGQSWPIVASSSCSISRGPAFHAAHVLLASRSTPSTLGVRLPRVAICRSPSERAQNHREHRHL